LSDPGAATLPRPTVLDTDAASSFACDYVAGVNRVLSLPPYMLVDNIGRNVEVWGFQPGNREPATRARYDLTTYPDDPIASLLDVDVHAAFVRLDGHELLTVNHYGRARRFALPAPSARLRPTGELQLLGDTERVIMAGDCFVASSPRGEYTDDPARPGIFLFEPIARWLEQGSETRRLAYDQALADWGVVSSLAVSPSATGLAVAAGHRLGVFGLRHRGAGLRLGACLWEATLTFHCQWLHVDEVGRLWSGGHRPSPAADPGDWDACLGGGIHTCAFDTGADDVAVELPEATAWGYGADPLVVAPGSREVYVLGRDASLYGVDLTGGARQLFGRIQEPNDLATPSLGIGHTAMRDGWLYAGFSRGGFRLLRYDLGPT
jgi:hypothetical protein